MLLTTCINTYFSAVCEAGDVRLRGGIDSSNGHVEVCQFRTWGAVCSDGWDDNDARVVCAQLGYDPQGLCGLINISVSLCMSCTNHLLDFGTVDLMN